MLIVSVAAFLPGITTCPLVMSDQTLVLSAIYKAILFTVLRPAEEFFTHIETSPLPVKGCKIYAYAWRSGPLSREGFLSCHTCCDTGLRIFCSYPKDCTIQSPLTTHNGMWRIYSNPNPHGLSKCHSHLAAEGEISNI
jgi:hypothetical protein